MIIGLVVILVLAAPDAVAVALALDRDGGTVLVGSQSAKNTPWRRGEIGLQRHIRLHDPPV